MESSCSPRPSVALIPTGRNPTGRRMAQPQCSNCEHVSGVQTTGAPDRMHSFTFNEPLLSLLRAGRAARRLPHQVNKFETASLFNLCQVSLLLRLLAGGL